MNILLAPATKENEQASLTTAVDVDVLFSKLSPERAAQWREAVGNRKLIHPWALSESKRSIFSQLNAGDLVLLSVRGSGRFNYRGIVSTKIECPDAGRHIWPLEGNAPWTLIYLISDLTLISIPKKDLLTGVGFDAGYDLPGANLLRGEKVEAALKIIDAGDFGPSDTLSEVDVIKGEFVFGDEIPVFNNERTEGALKTVLVNKYERDRYSRGACLDYWGPACHVCGFDSGLKYGDSFKKRIHVHHLNPISDKKGEYKIDAIKDLRPVCTNCHMIIHLRKPPYTIEEVRSFMK
jgi:hypothetical protein